MAAARLHSGPAPFSGPPEAAFLDLSAHVEHHIASYHDFRLSELRAAGAAAAAAAAAAGGNGAVPVGHHHQHGFGALPTSYFDGGGSDSFPSPLSGWDVQGFAPTYHHGQSPFDFGPFGIGGPTGASSGRSSLPTMTVQRGQGCKGGSGVGPSGSPVSGELHNGVCLPRGNLSGHVSKGSKPRGRVATVARRRAANIRERRRMFNLNSAFDKLRKRVPTFAYEKRLSRMETLRLAIMYIAFMTEVVGGKEDVEPTCPEAPARPVSFPGHHHHHHHHVASEHLEDTAGLWGPTRSVGPVAGPDTLGHLCSSRQV